MKKTILRRMAACMVLALLLFILSPALAEGTQLLPPAVGVDTPWVRLAVQGDALFMLRADGLYRWQKGELSSLQDFTKEGFDAPGGQVPHVEALVADESGLYALGGPHGPLWRRAHTGGAFQKLPGLRAAAEGDSRIYRHFFAWEGALYCTATDPMNPIPQLMELDLQTGDWLPVKSGVSLARPYGPGRMLVVRDERMQGGGTAVALLLKASGRLEDKLPLGGDYLALWTYPDEGDAYLLRKGEMWVSRDFSEPQRVMRLPMEVDVRVAAVLPGGRFVYAKDGAVTLLEPGDMPADAPGLRILGHTWDLPVSDFALQNPDVPLTFLDRYPDDTPALTLHMMSGEGAADVYVIYSSQYNLDALFEKGWYMDLGQDEAVQDALAPMYPYLRQALVRDGRILAVPFTASYAALARFTLAWQHMGLGTEDIPRSYPDLLRFVDRWNAELADLYPHISLFGAGADAAVYKQVLFNNLLTQWRLLHQAEGTPVRYAPLKGVIQQLLDTDFSRIGESDMQQGGMEGGRQVFFPGHDVFVGGGMEPVRFHALSVLEGTQAYTSADAMLLLVNPHTRNPQGALRFVRYVLEKLSPEARIFLRPDINEPVPMPGLNLDHYVENIAQTKAAMEKAEGAQRTELEAMLGRIEADYQEQQQHAFLVTGEGIQGLRALDDTFVLRQANEYPDGGRSMSQSIMRLLAGETTLEQFIADADQAEKLREAER